MTKFKDYSIPELYNSPSAMDPGQINWKSVAVYTGLGITYAIVFAAVIHYSQRSNLKLIIDQSAKVNRDLIAVVERQNTTLEDLIKSSHKLNKGNPFDSIQQQF